MYESGSDDSYIILNMLLTSALQSMFPDNGSRDKQSVFACASDFLNTMSADNIIAQRCSLAAANGGVPSFGPKMVVSGL